MRLHVCSACGRQGNRRKVVPQRGGEPVCRDPELCYRRFRFNRMITAMPTPEEEREQVRRMVAAKLAELRQR